MASRGQKEPVHKAAHKDPKMFPKWVLKMTVPLCAADLPPVGRGTQPSSVGQPLRCPPGACFEELMHGDALCRAEQPLALSRVRQDLSCRAAASPPGRAGGTSRSPAAAAR